MAASRRFYETHADTFDQLVFWTDSPVINDAFAFETTVQNAITGIGQEAFDFAAELGSAGALQSVVNMDRISKYGDTPAAKLFGEISPLGILAHETGHRWLARLMFRNADRTVSDQLLGRQLAHWSFFMDSDGSVMEGNEIEDLGGGVFRTARPPRTTAASICTRWAWPPRPKCRAGSLSTRRSPIATAKPRRSPASPSTARAATC